MMMEVVCLNLKNFLKSSKVAREVKQLLKIMETNTKMPTLQGPFTNSLKVCRPVKCKKEATLMFHLVFTFPLKEDVKFYNR